MATKIAWTDETWNPVVGCSKVSAGCLNCYAEKMAGRLANMGQGKYVPVVTDRWATEGLVYNGEWNGEIRCDETALNKPLHWRKPRRIFVCSMGDLFHPSVPFDFIDKVMAVIAVCQQHTFQVLTKRPERMREYFSDIKTPINITGVVSQNTGITIDLGRFWNEAGQPLKNLWLGVTAENQETADKRIPILLQIPAAVRFVSVEPMLEGIKTNPWSIGLPSAEEWHPQLNWVIIGCESGPKRRPCKLEWVRDLVNQCKAAGVPVFVKQLQLPKLPKGNWWGNVPKMRDKHLDALLDQCPNYVSHNPAEWPEDLRIRELPK